MKLDWDDLRFFLAVMENGSTKRAAAALKVDQTTCARRIAALETALGLELFRRDARGYRPTEHALALRNSAEQVGRATGRFEAEAAGRRRKSAQKIRLTSEELFVPAVIIPAVARFTQMNPETEVEIDISSDVRDLERGEADVAVRGGLEPTGPALIRRKLTDDPIGIYCSEAYADPPATTLDLARHPLACLTVHVDFIERAGLGGNIRHVCNGFGALRSIISSGNAVGPLSRVVARGFDNLKLCYELSVPSAIWLLYPERLRESRPVRRLGKVIAEEFAAAFRPI
jgi:DNA-binding transcriptional LysR family regulator